MAASGLKAFGAGHDALARKADYAALKAGLDGRIPGTERRRCAAMAAAAGLLFAALKLIP